MRILTCRSHPDTFYLMRAGHYGIYLNRIFFWLGTSNLDNLATAFPGEEEEIWDLEGTGFRIFSQDGHCNTERLSIGWLGYGYIKYGNREIKCVAEQNASPIMFYINKNDI